MPPANEYQLRQLLILPTAALQRKAWKRAVARGGTLSAAAVREAVRELQGEAAHNPLSACLLADRVFPGIPYRWEVCSFAIDETGANQVKLTELPEMNADSGAAMSDAPPLVLVSPDIDLFDIAPPDYLRQFAAVLAAAPEYRYLLWSSRPEHFRAVPDWPANVELVMRITCADDLTRLPEPHDAGTYPQSALWLLPLEPLTLPACFRYTRLLLGAAAGTVGKAHLDRTSCRRLLSDALNTSCPVHLAMGVQQLLC